MKLLHSKPAILAFVSLDSRYQAQMAKGLFRAWPGVCVCLALHLTGYGPGIDLCSRSRGPISLALAIDSPDDYRFAQSPSLALLLRICVRLCISRSSGMNLGRRLLRRLDVANKPVLLDIGAVWCHWCHVMDRESYDDAEVAAIVNEHYIAVKVDRDERPDIDSRYQAAVAALTGQAGGRLRHFLLPTASRSMEERIFLRRTLTGGPVSSACCFRLLRLIVTSTATLLGAGADGRERDRASGVFFGGRRKISATVIDAIRESARKMFDAVNGGFGSAPKFPHPAALDLVMDQYVRTRDKGEELRAIVVRTLEKMARGGVYDQLAGGFHRYSVDERWIVPHFEKMCYDNSELLKNLCARLPGYGG